MKLRQPFPPDATRRERASVFIIVLWVCIGLVGIALYFANTMTYELRASDNRVSGLQADQAIEGAARYVAAALQNFATNGAVPDYTQFKCEAVPIGDAKFWLIGRDPAATGSATEPFFSLVDEGGKLDLNTVSTNVLEYLPNMNLDYANAIMEWRGTNGNASLDYTSLGYQPKNAPFESVDELRLVYGMTMDMLVGEDVNRNGILDKNEKDLNSSGGLDPGLLEYFTVNTREPNFHFDSSTMAATTLTNVNTATTNNFISMFQSAGTSTSTRMAQQIYNYIHPSGGTGGTGGAGGAGSASAGTCSGMLQFALFCKNAGMSTDDFSRIADSVTTKTNTYITGRVNVNTASADVLATLIMGSMGQNPDESTAVSAAQTLVTYRQQNPGNLNSIAWVIDALGNNSPVFAANALGGGDYLTTRSYQFTADIAAVGPYGRGYRRVKFYFDVSNGTPKILYRQDLSRLGWVLGEKTREDLLANNNTP